MPSPGVTKRMLADAMKDLMATRPLAKISVGDIVSECNLNRNSFYYHFKDKYDLVNWVFYTEIIDELTEAESDGDSSWDMIGKVCVFFHNNKDFYANALSVSGQNSFSEYFADLLMDLVRIRAEGIVGNNEYEEFCASFFVDAITLSLFRWIKEGAKIPPQEFVQMLKKAANSMALMVEDGDKILLN